MKSSDPVPQRLCGIFSRKPRWGLSGLGWVLVLLVGCSFAVFLFRNAGPFLAETHRVPANTLVVEGWIHEYAIRAAVGEFREGAYQRLFATGGPIVGSGGYINDYQTSAYVGANLLKKNGLSDDLVEIVPSHVIDRDRTYASAVALRDWLDQHNTKIRSFNIVTEGAHARRTRLMFEDAFGKDVTVGVIAVANPDYNEGHWWRYSEGVKEVTSEALAYLYACFFFHPSEPPAGESSNRVSQVSR